MPFRCFLILVVLTALPIGHAQAIETRPIYSAETEQEFQARRAAEEQYAADKTLASTTYSDCLLRERGTSEDFTACDSARAALSTYLPAETADGLIACLEELVIGKERPSTTDCRSFQASHPRVIRVGPRWP